MTDNDQLARAALRLLLLKAVRDRLQPALDAVLLPILCRDVARRHLFQAFGSAEAKGAWNEGQHPRDSAGRFTAGGGGPAPSAGMSLQQGQQAAPAPGVDPTPHDAQVHAVVLLMGRLHGPPHDVRVLLDAANPALRATRRQQFCMYVLMYADWLRLPAGAVTNSPTPPVWLPGSNPATPSYNANRPWPNTPAGIAQRTDVMNRVNAAITSTQHPDTPTMLEALNRAFFRQTH